MSVEKVLKTVLFVVNLLVLSVALFWTVYSFYISQLGMGVVSMLFAGLCGFFAIRDVKSFNS